MGASKMQMRNFEKVETLGLDPCRNRRILFRYYRTVFTVNSPVLPELTGLFRRSFLSVRSALMDIKEKSQIYLEDRVVD